MSSAAVGVVVHQVGAEDEVDAPVRLERPHVQVAVQRADLVDADHLAERLERIDVGMLGARRADQLARERPRERPLADAVRAVEEVGVRMPFDERGLEQPLRLQLLGHPVEPAHAGISLCTESRTRAASSSGGSEPSSTT